jgi:hypothetical protein
LVYGQTHFDEEVFLNAYRKHNSEVLTYFKDRNDLLVLDVDKDGWKELCEFLDKPVPDCPFPVKNVTR